MRRDAFRPDGPTRLRRAAEVKGGPPSRAGTAATRTHAQRRLRREHGEDGEDPPLDRSEHRGTAPLFSLSTGVARPLPEN